MPTSTVQLRRYELKPELVDDFLVWFPTRLIPAREAHGFAVEFAFFDRDRMEFTWAVRVDGDADEFARVEKAYMASPERDAAFAGADGWTETATVSLVERIA